MKKNKGLTLIELLVVVSIMVLLSAVILFNYRDGQKRYALAQAGQKLVSDLRRAQTMSLSGLSVGGKSGGFYCGYGVLIKTNFDYYYQIYAEKSKNCDSNNRYDDNDEIIEEVKLPPGIKIESFSPSTFDIFFKPPEPKTYLKGQFPFSPAWVKLSVENSDLPTKKVIVTSRGLIQVE